LYKTFLRSTEKKNYPEAPSRFTCIYTSLIPRSAFFSRGDLYRVLPVGKTHITNAYIINLLNGEFDRIEFPAEGYGMRRPIKSDYKDNLEAYEWELKRYNQELMDDARWALKGRFEQYWNPGKNFVTKMKAEGRLNWVEVLCEKVKVLSLDEEKAKSMKNYLPDGGHAVLTQDIKDVSFYGYDSSGNGLLPPEESERVIKDFHGVKGKYNDWALSIPKGTKGKLKVYIGESPHRGSGYDSQRKPYRFVKFIPDGYNFYVDLLRHSHVPGQEYYKEKPNVEDLIKVI